MRKRVKLASKLSQVRNSVKTDVVRVKNVRSPYLIDFHSGCPGTFEAKTCYGREWSDGRFANETRAAKSCGHRKSFMHC